MPELPEVEYGRKVAEKTCKKKVIQEVHCDNDPIVFETKLPAEVKRALVGRRVLEICRRGKFLWFELDKSPWPIFHFGMTGAFHTPRPSDYPIRKWSQNREFPMAPSIHQDPLGDGRRMRISHDQQPPVRASPTLTQSP